MLFEYPRRFEVEKYFDVSPGVGNDPAAYLLGACEQSCMMQLWKLHRGDS